MNDAPWESDPPVATLDQPWELDPVAYDPTMGISQPQPAPLQPPLGQNDSVISTLPSGPPPAPVAQSLTRKEMADSARYIYGKINEVYLNATGKPAPHQALLAATERQMQQRGLLPPGIRAADLLESGNQQVQQMIGDQSDIPAWTNFAQGAMQTMAGMGTGLVASSGVGGQQFTNQMGQQMREDQALTYAHDPNSASGKLGGFVGNLASLPLLIENPALGAALMGASASGNEKLNIDAARAAGQNISGGQELAATVGIGLVNALAMYVGGHAAASVVGKILTPELAAAIEVGDETGMQALQGLLSQRLSAMGIGAADMVAQRVAENVVHRSTYAPNTPITEGAGEAAAAGGALGALIPNLADIFGKQPVPPDIQERAQRARTPQDAQALISEAVQRAQGEAQQRTADTAQNVRIENQDQQFRSRYMTNLEGSSPPGPAPDSEQAAFNEFIRQRDEGQFREWLAQQRAGSNPPPSSENQPPQAIQAPAQPDQRPQAQTGDNATAVVAGDQAGETLPPPAQLEQFPESQQKGGPIADTAPPPTESPNAPPPAETRPTDNGLSVTPPSEPTPPPLETPPETGKPAQNITENITEATPAPDLKPEAAPQTGKLDQLEAWARQRIADRRHAEASKLAELTPMQRRQRGSAGPLNPHELVDYTIIGAAKIAKGVAKLADWTKEMVAEVPELAKRSLLPIWASAKRFTKMDENGRAAWVVSKMEVPADESIKQTVRRTTGQTPALDAGRAITEIAALRASMNKAQQASRAGFKEGVQAGRNQQAADEGYQQAAVNLGYKTGVKVGKEMALRPREETAGQRIRRVTGQTDLSGNVRESDALAARMKGQEKAATVGYRAGVDEVTGHKTELARIVRENLPLEERGKMLDQVARISSMGQMRLALGKASRILADHQVREALAQAEKLTGKLQLDPVLGPKPAPKLGPKEKPLSGAEAVPMRPVDLKKLEEPYREDVRKLIEKARLRKNALSQAKTVEEKQAAVEDFQQIVADIRQQVAENNASRETRIGNKKMLREEVVKDGLEKIQTAPAAKPSLAAPSNESPRDANVFRRFFGRLSTSMETVIRHLEPKRGNLWGVTIENIRRGQEGFHGEQQAWHEHFTKALDKADIPAGSMKLDDFMNRAQEVNLPDAGKLTLTRNELVGLAATADDPQTRSLIRMGARWSFKDNPLGKAFVLSDSDVGAIEGMLSPGEKGMISAFKDYNASKIRDRLMQKSIEIRGSAPDTHEGYFPRSRNRQMVPEAGMPPGWRGHYQREIENVSILKERTADMRSPLNVPKFIQETYRYMDNAAKVMHLAEPVRTAAMVWEDPRLRGAVEEKFGKGMNPRIDQFLADSMLTRQPGPESIWAKWSNIATRQVSRAWLQLNPSPMAKNVIGGTISLLPKFDLVDWSAGLKAMFSPKTYQRMIQQSSIAWERYSGGLYGKYSPLAGREINAAAELDFGQALKLMATRPGSILRGAGAAVDAMKFMAWADSVPLRTAFAASEHFVERTQPGLSPEARQRAVLDKFHEAVYATQNGSSSTELSELASQARQNPITQAMLLFTSDANKKLNLLMQMRDAPASEKLKTLTAVGLNVLASAAVGYGLKQGASAIGHKVGGTEPSDEETSRAHKTAGLRVLQDLAGTVYGGQLMVDFVHKMTDPKYDSNMASPPVEAAADIYNKLANLGDQLIKHSQTAEDSPEEKKSYGQTLKAMGDFVTSTRTLAGDPTVPLTKLLERGWKAATAKPEDQRFVERRKNAAESKALRDSLSGPARTLLQEKNHLDQLPMGELTQEELSRKGELMQLEKLETMMLGAQRRGDKANAAEWKKMVEEEAKRLRSTSASPALN